MLDENILASLGSGYIRRADTVLPRQGRALPWRVLHNYELDRPMLLKEAIDDGRLEFVPASAAASAAQVSLDALDTVLHHTTRMRAALHDDAVDRKSKRLKSSHKCGDSMPASD